MAFTMLFLVSLAFAGDGLVGELAVEGPLKQRLSAAPADLVVFYAGEQKGSMETCGCPKRPRGSLARLDAYVDAARGDTPAVLVNGGYWLEDAMGFEGQGRPDVALMNQWMLKGVAEGGWDALNVAPNDLAGLSALDPAAWSGLPVVSANVSGPGIRPYVVVERGGHRVGITGIAGPGVTLSDTSRWTVSDPATVGPVLEELAGKADVVVLLAYKAEDAAKALARKHDVDVIVETNAHREFVDPERVGSAARVASHYQTMRAGELRLTLEKGRVKAAVDRKIDLDPDMPDDPALAKLTRQAREEVDAVQQGMYGP
jgi:2',3'-cyclic-nucleotide 2'-phosphodiesterase (5'-nucleotidase family)